MSTIDSRMSVQEAAQTLYEIGQKEDFNDYSNLFIRTVHREEKEASFLKNLYRRFTRSNHEMLTIEKKGLLYRFKVYLHKPDQELARLQNCLADSSKEELAKSIHQDPEIIERGRERLQKLLKTKEFALNWKKEIPPARKIVKSSSAATLRAPFKQVVRSKSESDIGKALLESGAITRTEKQRPIHRFDASEATAPPGSHPQEHKKKLKE